MKEENRQKAIEILIKETNKYVCALYIFSGYHDGYREENQEEGREILNNIKMGLTAIEKLALEKGE